ncbi:MAG: large conductance mechanosensitive channel protein MscL [Actinomycetota bacterium]
MLKDFRQFVLRGNVVDLAVGVVIGAAFGAIINSLVKGLIDPLTSFAGTGDLAARHFCIGGYAKGTCRHLFNYGGVVSSIIQFVLIAAAVFFFVVKPVNHLMEIFKTEQPKGEETRQCPECLSKIPIAARRCAYCTAAIGAA